MYTLISFFIILFIISFSKNEKLIFVELQSRHGARAPLVFNESNQDYLGQNWTNLGELTGIGQRMEYILGLRNRIRYINKYGFLSKKFDPHEILVFSTSINRTLLSMTSQLLGLYPITESSGEILNSEQLEISIPPINISNVEIEEINSLGNWSMPNNITLIPIHMISPSEKRIVVYDNIECKEKVDAITLKNKNENKYLVKLTKDFYKNYQKNLSKVLPFPKNNDFEDIGKLCDALFADSLEGKDLTYFFNKTNIDKDILFEKCNDILGASFSHKLFGDEKNEVLLLEESQILREMIHYMRQRVDADKNGEKIEDNITDYSRPKMVIISGHDTTLAAQILFILKYFNLDLNIYKLPTYSAQVAFEVTRNENNENKTLKDSDYFVCFYFNDDLILNTTMDNFINTVEKNIWTTQQINEFCSNKKDKKNTNGKKDKINTNVIIIISLGVLILFLIISIIILIIKIKIKKRDKEDLNSLDSDQLLNEE